jgi:hypothetical protein
MKGFFSLFVLTPIGEAALLGQQIKISQRGQRQLSDLEKTQSDASATLSSLLRNLEAEQEAAGQFSGTFHQWCQDSEGQKQGMIETIQRKVDETNIMMRQIKSDSKRLESELNLIQANNAEKVKQLQEADDTESFASEEYVESQKDMDKTIEAARHAVRLVSSVIENPRARHAESGDVDAVSNLMQLNSDTMTDAEKSIMGAYVDDPKPTDNNQPRELLSTLNEMLSRLESDRSGADTEHNDQARKLALFSDHLNSSIIETQSQIASIQMEMAQRQREEMRLQGQVSDLERILKNSKDGKANTQTACFQHQQEKVQSAKFITAEIDAVKTVLEQTSPESADMFLDIAAPVSFLQARQETSSENSPIRYVLGDLSSMARKYPEQAAWYISEANGLTPKMSKTAAIAVSQHVEPAAAAPPTSDSRNDPLKDIQQFVNSADAQDGGDVAGLTGEARPLLSDPDEVQKIKTSYKSLLSRIESKQRSVQDREKWCQATMRDSKMDGVMVTQNLKRMNAKLNLVKVAMLQYEKSSQYYVDQGKLMQSQVQKLSDLAKEEEHEYSKSYKTLSDFSKQLMSLATELTQVLTTEERRNADMVKSLVQKLENHQNMLEVQHRMWGKWRDELVQADSAIQAALQTNIQHNDRRVMQFKTETQFLTSLSHAKQNDKALSAGYQQISRQMCSKDIVAGMKTEIDTLQKQATELQNSFTQNVAPFA